MIFEEFLPNAAALIAARLKTALPALRECKEHPGRFTEDEIKRMAVRTPSVRVALLGVNPRPGEEHLSLDLAAFIVTTDAVGLPRHRSAQAIMARIIGEMRFKNWGELCFGRGELVDARNLYNGNHASRGVSLWAVRWRQPLAWMPEPVEASKIERLYVGQAPKIGADHVDDYTRIGGGDGE